MKKIQSVKQILSYFQQNECPLFFVGTLYGTAVLNIYPFIPQYQIITCCDPYFGTFPFIKVPSFISNADHQCGITGEQCPISILKNPQVIAYMKSKHPHPKILLKAPQPELIKICNQHGFQLWITPLDMYQYLGNKVEILNILKAVEVPYIPNICSVINSYQHFKQIISSLGSQIVVQDQSSSGGYGTMFISNQQEYKKYQETLQNGKVFKIMKRRNLKCFAIVGVATKKGAILGPLVAELVGHQRLTPNLGGYCGNQIRRQYFQDKQIDMKVRREIYRHTQKFINYIYEKGFFKGSFGCDFSVDMDTHQVFFMEINPRLTGSTTISFELYEAQGQRFPIFLYHCLQFLGIDIEIDIKALNQEWIGEQHYQEEYSHLVVRAFNQSQGIIPYTFAGGIWRIEDGVAKPTGKVDFRLVSLQEDEMLVIPGRGIFKLTMGFKGRIQDYNFKLTDKYRKIIDQIIEYRLKDFKQK